MARRGIKPDPTALRLLKGNPQKRPINAFEPEFDTSVPECPAWLGEVGRAKWAETMSVLLSADGLMTKADGDLLALYCDTWDLLLKTRKEIDEHGMLIETKTSVIANPALRIRNTAVGLLKQLAALFGMSPSDRAALKLPPSLGGQDEFATMLQERDVG